MSDLVDAVRAERRALIEPLLAIVAGESYDAIAERIGVSVKSIDNAIRRARSKARVIVRELGLGLGSEAA